MVSRLTALAAPLVLMVAACASGPTATPTASPGPTRAGGAGTECASVPTFSLEHPAPSFEADPLLESAFPSEVDGQPVTNVQSVSFLEFSCAHVGQEGVDRFIAETGLDLAAMSFGFADAMVGDDSIQVVAFRTASQDGATIAQSFQQLAAMSGAGTEQTGTITTSSVGGKDVTVVTDRSGQVTYLYASGQVLFGITGVAESQAAPILAALP